MNKEQKCMYKIICKDEEFACDGICCLRERIFSEGLPSVASKIFNIDIEITRSFAKVKGDCKPKVS